MIVDLVYPASVSGSENYSSEAPLGPIALYSSLDVSQRGNVRFLDSTILSQNDIEQNVNHNKADVVALSCTTFNYSNALRVAALAKKNGSYVIAGGIHVTYMRDAILSKMLRGERSIDFLVTNCGEPTLGALLTALADGSSLTEIPNLSFVQNGRIVVNPVVNTRSGADPLTVPLVYDNIDFKRYSENFQCFGNLSSVRIAAPIFTQRGCAYSGSRKCTFCSIEQMNPRRSSELFEQDVISLITQHNVDHIRINDGDFTLDVRHMARIADAAERAAVQTGVRPLYHCFTRADEIDEERIAILKRLNVVSLFIGYESGSDKMLRVMQKHTTREQNLRATELLKQHGIDVICGGLVLGAEGESEETLTETLEFVDELQKTGNTKSLLTSPIIPLPGAPAFKRLMLVLEKDDPAKFLQLASMDDFDLEELVDLWNRHMCKDVSLRRLNDVCKEIEDKFSIGIRWIKLHQQ